MSLCKDIHSGPAKTLNGLAKTIKTYQNLAGRLIIECKNAQGGALENEVEYNEISRPDCLRLEDSFLPGA